MRPNRIIVGEVRQEECLDLLIALNSGLPGMCTIHANSARQAVTKMCTLPLLAGENVGHAFVVPTVAASIDLVVHAATDAEGRRRVTEIVAVPGRVEGDVVETAQIFTTRGGNWSAPTATHRTRTASVRPGSTWPTCSASRSQRGPVPRPRAARSGRAFWPAARIGAVPRRDRVRGGKHPPPRQARLAGAPGGAAASGRHRGCEPGPAARLPARARPGRVPPRPGGEPNHVGRRSLRGLRVPGAEGAHPAPAAAPQHRPAGGSGRSWSTTWPPAFGPACPCRRRCRRSAPAGPNRCARRSCGSPRITGRPGGSVRASTD